MNARRSSAADKPADRATAVHLSGVPLYVTSWSIMVYTAHFQLHCSDPTQWRSAAAVRMSRRATAAAVRMSRRATAEAAVATAAETAKPGSVAARRPARHALSRQEAAVTRLRRCVRHRARQVVHRLPQASSIQIRPALPRRLRLLKQPQIRRRPQRRRNKRSPTR